MSKIIFIYTLRSLPFSIAIHYPSPYQSLMGIFKQAIQFVYLSWSSRLNLTYVTHTKKSHGFFYKESHKAHVEWTAV